MSTSENRITRDIAIKLANSYMTQFYNLPKPPKGELLYAPRHNRVFLLSRDVLKLHKQVMMFPQVGSLLDDPPSDEEISKMYDEKREHYIENILRKTAIGFNEILDIDKPSSTTQLTVNVSQANVQNLNNLVDVVNSLAITTENKKRITELMEEFDEEAKTGKNKEKLRGILFKVAELSIDASSFLLKHAQSMGILSHLLS